MTERKRDRAFEALAEVTSTDWTVGRGILNKALSDIKTQQPGLDDDELAGEIHYRAGLYRRMFDGATLTPNALAKHWLRIFEESKRTSARATNQATVRTDCSTCDGHRFVVVATRPAVTTQWMKEHGFKGSGEIEEYAPCPDCSSIDTSFRRFDGTWHRSPDPEKVREMMRL